MKLFIDTADLEEIKKYADLGIIDGVTTNPSLFAKEKISFKEGAEKICKLVNGPVSLEVVATDFDGMIKEGIQLSRVHKNVVVKLPCTQAGIKATKALAGKGIKVNLTLVFSSAQALLAAKAGAAFVSPFVGRLDDISQNGMDLIRDIRTIYDNYSFKTEILVASVRHPVHVVESALIGADAATCPPKVLEMLFNHPKTDEGLRNFLEDWKKSKKSL